MNLGDIKGIMKSENKENSILRIIQGDKAKFDAMIKEIQYDYLSDHIIHVDFIRIDLNKPVEVEVPVVLDGEADRRQDRGRPAGVHPPRDPGPQPAHQHPQGDPRRYLRRCTSASRSRWRTCPRPTPTSCISPANTVICAVAAKAKEEVVEVAEAAEGAVEGAVEGAAGRRCRRGTGCRRGRCRPGAAAAPDKDKGKDPDKGKDKDKGKGKEK